MRNSAQPESDATEASSEHDPGAAPGQQRRAPTAVARATAASAQSSGLPPPSGVDR